MRSSVWIAGGLALLLVSGCSDDSDEQPGGADAQQQGNDAGVDTAPAADATETDPPTVSFKSLSELDALQGQVAIGAEASSSVEKVELLVGEKVVASADAAPFSISWDTTGTADGVVSVKLKAYAGDQTAESEVLQIILYNNGEEATYLNANDTTMTIVSGADNHVKTHWSMPAGIKRVIAAGFWENQAFKMDISIGIGICPHKGTEAKREASDTSPILVDFSSTSNLAQDNWFVHIGATNESELTNQSTKLWTHVYLLK